MEYSFVTFIYVETGSGEQQMVRDTAGLIDEANNNLWLGKLL